MQPVLDSRQSAHYGHRTLLRCIVVVPLIVSLIESSVLASPERALGLVTEAQRARVGSVEASVGSTVFAGDILSTEPTGILRVSFGTAQLRLAVNSSAVVRETTNGVSVDLQRGYLIISASGAESLEVRASDVRIRPTAAQPTYSQVGMESPCALLVTSEQGSLDVTAGEETRTIPAPTTYRVLIRSSVSDPACETSPHGTLPAGRNRFVLLPLVLISVASAIVIEHALVSPSAP